MTDLRDESGTAVRPFSDTLVIGAGPGGLAVAAELGRRGIGATVLERDTAVGSSWRRHYERLHLHTPRRLSQLPGYAMPRSYGRWVARADVVEHLERYAAHHRIDVRTETPVLRIARADGVAGGARWAVHTADGPHFARTVVVATGHNHTPYVPDWPGRESFTGELLHAADYRVPAPFAGRDVLVVGVGNTGAEIAVDLAEGGARRVRIAVRTPPHIVRRSTGGMSAQATGILVRHLPTGLVDRVSRINARLTVPDLAEYGLPRPSDGLYTRIKRDDAIPLQDVGFIDAVVRGAVEVVAAPTGFDGAKVLLADGTGIDPDVVVVAVGYRRALEGLVGDLGVLRPDGRPSVHGPVCPPGAPGLYFTGFTNPISGMFRELAIDARRIARAVNRAT
ncbi:flavin-containing monooxygenase [Yinghuangia soli]|uniref:NAD(P)/FAD-dependent oxidoreductase n=1 Tax=Yinghuangia soli TaxID=2908204 RepID=A0AA41Q7K5_9ACTN|nr:NAD(P)/FAD-dependent oxidoreductase [Yinghuangia soli]MCF2532385.1 NAD(P)/FAD-dependent oxidoreductase [Yinghuangia soli]